MLNSKKIRVSTRKRVYFQKFLRFLASVVAAASMFLLVFALCCRSTCQFRVNSEKSNHMLSATSEIELEFLTKLLNMSKLQIRLILLYHRVPLHLNLYPPFSLTSQKGLEIKLFSRTLLLNIYITKT